MQTVKILITGPTGSGKTTVAKMIAKMLLDNGRDVTVRDEVRPLENDSGSEVGFSNIDSAEFPPGPPKNTFEVNVVQN